MKRLYVWSLALILLTSCSIQKELNTYYILPEVMRLKYIDADPSVVIHQDACNVEIETVCGIGYAWGRCSDINENKLTYGNYLDYLSTDEENFYLQKEMKLLIIVM